MITLNRPGAELSITPQSVNKGLQWWTTTTESSAWAAFTCSSWCCCTEWPLSRHSTRCSTTGSHLRRSDTAFLWSSPANSDMVVAAFGALTAAVFQMEFRHWQTGMEWRSSRWSRPHWKRWRWVWGYLASKTQTTLKQWVLHFNLRRSTRQTKIWNYKSLTQIEEF